MKETESALNLVPELTIRWLLQRKRLHHLKCELPGKWFIIVVF